MTFLAVMTVAGCAVLGLASGPAHTQTQPHPQPFAPQAGMLVDVQRPARAELCLNGTWSFQAVDSPVPADPASHVLPPLPPPGPDAWEKTPIKVPSPWNVNSFAQGQDHDGGDFVAYPSYPRAWEDVRAAWLHKTVVVPRSWKGQVVRLHFEAVAGDVVVLVNGMQVGTHFEQFLPFDLDVTQAVRPGAPNDILVGIRHADLLDQPGGHTGTRPYPAGSFWGQHIAGIWQDVFLVALPQVHVEDVAVRPRVDANILEVDATVQNQSPHAVTATVRVAVRRWERNQGLAPVPAGVLTRTELQLPATKVRIPAGQTVVVRMRQQVGKGLARWSTHTPTLHGAVVTVDAAGVQDVGYARFGWRQVGFTGSSFTLNARPLRLQGEAWHFMGIPQLSRRYAAAWFGILKEAGVNAVRLHAQPYPSFYLDVADEVGMLVLDETALWGSDGLLKVDSPDFWRRSHEHVEALVVRDRNHPSVFGWSVENELVEAATGMQHVSAALLKDIHAQLASLAKTCSRLDSTRPWVSADGDWDVAGALPVAVVHYPDTGVVGRLSQQVKPWGVGESGLAYNGTPNDVARFNGDRAYESMQGRMEGVAHQASVLLKAQQDAGATFSSVFNLTWYGLQPLELGQADVSRAPRPTDGIFFTRFQEGVPGVQPERLGPYCTTINPGWDPNLPLRRTWPLFDAVQARFLGKPSRWESRPIQGDPPAAPPPVPVERYAVAATLEAAWRNAGLPVANDARPRLLVLDGRNPGATKEQVDRVLGDGGTVLVWGALPDALDRLNAVLPARLELTKVRASSLAVRGVDPLLAGITTGSVHFSNTPGVLALDGGLAGPLVAGGTVLLEASATDWRRWNDRPEPVKTASVLRSEREHTPGGAALVVVSHGPGRLVLAKLDVPLANPQAREFLQRLLANLGAH